MSWSQRNLAFSLVIGVTTGFAQADSAPQKSLTPEAPLTLFLGGDVLPGRGVTSRWNAGQTPLHFFAPLARCVDVAFCNLEGASFDSRRRRMPHFDLTQLEGLQTAGFDVVSLANNHALDGGESGLHATAQRLRGLGLQAVGGTVGANDWRQIERSGVTFLAASQYGLFDSGTAHLSRLNEALVEQVRDASRHAPVVVSLHWGVEGDTAPSAWQRVFAHRLINAGASVVVGHHPHVAGPVESYRGRPIFYSLGNFVWDTMPRRAMPQPQSGMVAWVQLEPNGRAQWKTWPVVPTDEGPLLPKGETRLGSAGGLFAQRDSPERIVWSRDAQGRNRLRDWRWNGTRWWLSAQSVAGDLTKIAAGDVDGNGRDELLVEVRQGAKLETQILPRFQVYGVEAGKGFIPLWRGSHLSRPFLGWTTFPNTRGKGVGILAREVNRAPEWKGREWLALYRWNDFGFRLTWEISVRGQIQKLRSGCDVQGPWATFTQVDNGQSQKWRLRPEKGVNGTEKLRAERAASL